MGLEPKIEKYDGKGHLKQEFLLKFTEDPTISVQDAAEAIDRHRSTIYTWFRQDPFFRKHMKAATHLRDFMMIEETKTRMMHKVEQETDDVSISELVRFNEYLESHQAELDFEQKETALERSEIQEIMEGIEQIKLREKGLKLIEGEDGEFDVKHIDREEEFEDKSI